MTQTRDRAVGTQTRRMGRTGPGFLGLALAALFICQFAVLCYFNFTQLRNHMGYDSSWNFLRAAMMWNEKTLVSPAWSETTNLHLDTHWPIACLLYGLTGNLLLSFGIANTVMVILLLFLVWKILDRLEVRFNGKMIALNLVACPYLSTEFFVFNDLGYFSNILSGASYYTVRILVLLLIIYEFLKISRERRMGGLVWIIWPLCLLCGFSSGVYLIVAVLIPFLVYEVEMAVIRNDWKQLTGKESLFAVLCCAFVIAGKALAAFLIRFSALDGSRTWTSLENLWTNFGAVIQGYMKLLQVLPVSEDDKPLLTVSGLSRVFILAVFALLVIAVISMIRRVWKNREEKNGACLFLVNYLLVSFLIFGLYNARYGASIFEERYMIASFFVTVLIAAVFLDGLEDRSVLSVLLTAVMVGSILMVDVHSDYNYLRTTNDSWQMGEIQALAEERDAGVVYFWGEDLAVIRRSLRACDLNRIYKEIPDEGGCFSHWGDYTVYDDQTEYSGPTLLVCDPEKKLVPESVLEQYTLVKELDRVRVYACDSNPPLF